MHQSIKGRQAHQDNQSGKFQVDQRRQDGPQRDRKMTRKNDQYRWFGKCRFLQPIELQSTPVRHRHVFWFDFKLSRCQNKRNRNAFLVRYRPLRRDVHVSSVGEPNRVLLLGGNVVRRGTVIEDPLGLRSARMTPKLRRVITELRF
jgi:hypothetical protein